MADETLTTGALILGLQAFAVMCGPAALTLATFTWWTSRGRRIAEFERSLTSGIQNLNTRVESSETIVRSVADEAMESFGRAEASRKRGAQHEAQAKRMNGGGGGAEAELVEHQVPANPEEERHQMLEEVDRKLALVGRDW